MLQEFLIAIDSD